MSIRAKILLGCLSLTLLTLGVGLLGNSAQSRLGGIALRLYDDAFMSMSYLRAAQNELVAVSRDASRGPQLPPDLAARFDGIVEDLDVARTRALSPQGAARAAELQRAVAALARHVLDADAAAAAGMEAALMALDEAVEVFAGDGYRSRRAAVAVVEQTMRRTWVVMGASIMVALAITALLAHAIVPSLHRAVGVATAIAAGKLDNEIKTTGRSETATLLRALAAMQASIAGKIARIQALMAAQASTHAVEIASQHQRFEAALENMSQGLCMFDAADRLLVANRRFAEMFGRPPEGAASAEALPAILLDPHPAAAADPPPRVLPDGRVIASSRRTMPGGGWVATYEDVTERHRVEARIAHMARHDALTGLPNRTMYREQMEHALARARRGGGLAVFCVDLDNFRSANDTLGHAVGDALLREAAQRLLQATRDSDLVVRLGGDEFAIVQSDASQPTDAKSLAERLVGSLGRPFEVAGHVVSLGGSIGIAVTRDGLETADGLLKGADLALSRARADGCGTYRFFEADMDARMQARRLLEVDLRRAVAEEQFEVFYQPLVATGTGEVDGFEALVRWRHPERGMVSPAEFIPLAEAIGLISAIGACVLNRACADAAQWPASIKIAVNLSPLQFRNKLLARDVAAALDRSGLDAGRLELEITESLLLQDSDATLAILHDLRRLGVSISMDDFGTGYSSLSYLRRFPFDKIKIDQSFIRHIADRVDCIAIVRAVVGLGASLGMRVTAEGVETQEQYDLLRREGCDQVQGYLFSPPRPATAVPGLIERFTAVRV